MKRKAVFKPKNIIESNLLDSMLFGMGRTLQELMGTKSGYTTLKSIGTNMLEYLKKNEVDFIVEDPYQTMVNLSNYYVREGFAENVEVKQKEEEISFTVHRICGSKAFNELDDHYGGAAHVRPSPLLALMFASLAKIGYEADLNKLDHDSRENIWHIGMRIEKIESKLSNVV